jgi:Cu2+-exporting ATPase
VFDKTGTLTKNRLSVSTIYAGNGISDSFVLSYASKLSDYSGHRYSHAIQAESLRRHIPPVQQPGDGEDVAGYGVHWESKDESDHFLLGSRAFLLEAGVPYVPDFSYSGCYLAYNQKFAGFIRIEDELKAAAQHVIHSIKQENFQTILLSGDISSSCQRVANTLEIDRCVGEQKPQEKQKHLEDFRRQGSVVYVGDGLNDNLALSTADLGVTLENATTLTQVCASVVILKGDISQLPLLLKFSYNFRKIVHQNLVFSLLYNMIAIPLAASGILSPLLAIGAMLCSSLSITLNTWLRVRKIGVSKEAIHKGEQYKAAFE